MLHPLRAQQWLLKSVTPHKRRQALRIPMTHRRLPQHIDAVISVHLLIPQFLLCQVRMKVGAVVSAVQDAHAVQFMEDAQPGEVAAGGERDGGLVVWGQDGEGHAEGHGGEESVPGLVYAGGGWANVWRVSH